MPEPQTPSPAQKIGQATAKLIAAIARGQFARLIQMLLAGTDPQKAMQEVQAAFTGAFAEQLAQAFSELLQRSVGVAEVRAMPIAGLTLSQRLYAYNQQTTAEVLALINQHTQGVMQARELALRLYDGYMPGDNIKRPLEGSARADLPQALRELASDPKAGRALEAIYVRGQEMAANLKTGALRAAYAELLDAWQKGAGFGALQRKLEIAQREKNRYFANRIAQTELSRAYEADRARRLMADDTISVVQVMLNPMHPRTDICDYWGRSDLYGLGPGCYPKTKAPRPPFHPYCWCTLRSRPSLRASDATQKPGSDAAYLRSMRMDEAARVMGSRARAEAVIGGLSVDSVVNANKDPMYRLVRLGDPAAQAHALVNPISPESEP